MIVSNAAIDRRMTVYVLLALFVATGLYSYWALPREDNPEVIIPILLVTTTYPGVAPSDIESLVTIPIERKLTGLSGVKKIESSSAEGMSFIRIEFPADEDIDQARQRVRDKVDEAMQDIPVAADDPVIDEVNVSELPLMFLSLVGETSLALLTNCAEDLEDDLESIKGVPGEFTTADEIKDLVVKPGPDGAVYIRDIAEVPDGFKDVETIPRLDARPAVTLTVSKRAGENIIRIAGEVRGVMERFRPRLLPGMDMAITMRYHRKEVEREVRKHHWTLRLYAVVLRRAWRWRAVTVTLFATLLVVIAGSYLPRAKVEFIPETEPRRAYVNVDCPEGTRLEITDGIVRIDFINVRRQEGAPTDEAIVEAGIARFRPVMLTAITTVLGLVPMAIGINFDFLKWEWIAGGESSQWWGAMAISVISGLSFATLLTLIVVPTLYNLSVSFTNLFLSSAPEHH